MNRHFVCPDLIVVGLNEIRNLDEALTYSSKESNIDAACDMALWFGVCLMTCS